MANERSAIFLKESVQGGIHSPKYSLSFELVAVPEVKPDWHYITSPEVQRVILSEKLIGRKIGEIELRVNPEKKLLQYSYFYPMGEEGYYDHRVFGKIGVGGLVELQVLRMLKSRFKGFNIHYGGHILVPRQNQLHDRGIENFHESMPIEKAYELCKKQVQRNYSKNKSKRTKIKVEKKPNWIRRLASRFRRKKSP